jgi:DNA-binding YbaB/EbfC family protein
VSDPGSEGFDLSGLFAQAQAMQEQLATVQAQAAATTVEGQSGGGAVKVVCTGSLQFESVVIAPDAVDPNDVAMLEDLVLAAVRDAVAKANALTTELMGPLASLGGIGGLLP